MLKTILSQVKEYKLPSILTPLCMLAEVVVEMIIPPAHGLHHRQGRHRRGYRPH